MKAYVVGSLVVLSVVCHLSMSIPQNYHNQNQEKRCRNIKDVKYVEDTVCNTKYERQCSTKYKRVCNPYQEEICRHEQRRHCDDKRRKKCRQEYKTVSEPYTEDHCEDVDHKECEKTWQPDGYGGKVWQEDPHSCRYIKKTKCSKVQKQRQRQEPYEVCDWETYQDCYNVPEKKCNYVTKEKCKNEPYSDCHQVPKKDCVHKQIPTQVVKRVCKGDPEWSDDYDGDDGDYDYDDVHDDVIDVRDEVGDIPYTAQGVANAFNNANNRPRGSGVVGTKDNQESQEDDHEGDEGDGDKIVFGR